LNAAGHPEWLATSVDEYVRVAVELAGATEKRVKLRTELREDLRVSPLLDHAGQSECFGAALRDCWRAWCGRSKVAGA